MREIYHGQGIEVPDRILEEGVKEVIEAPKLSQAANFAQRAAERRKTSWMCELFTMPAAPTITAADIPEAETEPGGPSEFDLGKL